MIEYDEETWTYPMDIDQFNKLKKIMSEPVLTGDLNYHQFTPEDKLVDIFGDQQLFDDIDMLRDKYGTKYDVRKVIANRLLELIDQSMDDPYPMDDELEILALDALDKLKKYNPLRESGKRNRRDKYESDFRKSIRDRWEGTKEKEERYESDFRKSIRDRWEGTKEKEERYESDFRKSIRDRWEGLDRKNK